MQKFVDSFEKRQFVWTFFNIENNTLSNSKAMKSYFDEKIILDKIQIWGIISNISKVFLNDHEIRFEYIKKENVSFNSLKMIKKKGGGKVVFKLNKSIE